MKKIVLILAAAAMLATLSTGAVASEEEFSYIGVKKCKMCHRKDEDGAQFTKWSEGPHAKAFTELAGEQSLAIAKEKGIDNPQEADQCLKCHVTGHGEGDRAASILPENGVGCESCHGAGSAYYKKSDMTAIYNGEVDGTTLGLNAIDEATCMACHNEESPTYKEFDYEEARKQIAHPIPPRE